MTEQKVLTIDQAKEKISKLENAYSNKLDELSKAEKVVNKLKAECLEKLQELSVSQNQFLKGVIDIQNKQLEELNAKVESQKKALKKSSRKDNL